MAPVDIEAALGAIVALTVNIDHAAGESPTAPPTVLGARAVHFVEPPGPTRSYSVSSPSPSIDSCAVRLCSCGHRCSGAYTPRVATCSIEASATNDDAEKQTPFGVDGGDV